MNNRSVWFSSAVLGGLAACSAGTSSSPVAAVDPPGRASQAATPMSSAAAAGERIYSGSCIACHQHNAQGIPGVYPSLVGSPVVLGDPKDLALWVIKGQRPPSMPVARYSTAMRQFSWMKPEDAAALFTYLRSNFGNAAAPVDAAIVAQAVGE
jgi:mono/diheme cytochrome c family protein